MTCIVIILLIYCFIGNAACFCVLLNALVDGEEGGISPAEAFLIIVIMFAAWPVVFFIPNGET